jgi:hypothetical protein
VKADLGAMEDVREVLLGGDLAEDRPLALPGRGERERERRGGLADAPFAGDDEQPFVEQAVDGPIISTCRRRKAQTACE